ncbi:MAG: hypothetical protein H6581_14885 [Bacteroidia bacterium]|nr:hypothetical protein [Bacteroidia bacterium]
MRKATLISLAFFLGICLWTLPSSCGSANASGNGDSELTLLMRKMEKHMQTVRKKVEKGNAKIDVPDWNEIYTAPSSKSEMDTITFKSFAYALLKSAENLENASQEEQPKVYKALVDVCMTCHTAMCPGPKVRIKKLYLPN